MFCSVCGTILDLSHERCQSCFHKIPGLARARIESSSSLSKKDRWAQQYCTLPSASSFRKLPVPQAPSNSSVLPSADSFTPNTSVPSPETRASFSTSRPPNVHRSISNVSTSSTGTASSIDDAQPLIPSITGSSNASTASLQKVFGSVLDSDTPESAKCSVCKDPFGKLGGGGGGRIFPLPGTDPASLDARFLCAPCYARDYKKGDCKLCTKPVLGIINDPSIRVGSSFWHERCFQCTRCAGKATLVNIHRHPTCEECFHSDPAFIPTDLPPGVSNQSIRHTPSSNLGGYALPTSISSSSSRPILRISPLPTSTDDDNITARSPCGTAPSVENLKNRFSFTPAAGQTGLSSRTFDRPNRGHGKSHSVGVAVVRDAHGELAVKKGVNEDEQHGIWTPGGFKKDYQGHREEQIGTKETRDSSAPTISPLVSNTTANIVPVRPSSDASSAIRQSSRVFNPTNITTAPRSPVSLSKPPLGRNEPTTPRASRFGGMTICPGCTKSIGPMERGSVVGPAGLGCNIGGEERWHQSCLACGGGTNRGPQKANRAKLMSTLTESDSRAGCGRPLDSGAKIDDEGGVWCRDCVSTISRGTPRSSSPQVLSSSTRSVNQSETQPIGFQPKAAHRYARSEDLSCSPRGHKSVEPFGAPSSSAGLGSSIRGTYRGVPSPSPSSPSKSFTRTQVGSTGSPKGHARKDSLKYSAARVTGFRDDSWNPTTGNGLDDIGSARGIDRGDKAMSNVNTAPKRQDRGVEKIPVVSAVKSACENLGKQRQEGKATLPIVGKSGGMSILERAGVRRKV